MADMGFELLTEELRRKLFYETHMHRLGPREVKQFFDFFESAPNLDEALLHFIDTWEILLELLPSMPDKGEYQFPGIRCIHCDEPVYFRDEGENAEYLPASGTKGISRDRATNVLSVTLSLGR